MPLPAIDLSVIIQGAMLAVMIWYGRKVQAMAETMAVHDHVIHKDHAPRLERLEQGG